MLVEVVLEQLQHLLPSLYLSHNCVYIPTYVLAPISSLRSSKASSSLPATGHSVPLSGGVYLINRYSSFKSLESLVAQLVKNLLAMQET